MDVEQLQKRLQERFAAPLTEEEKRRIVFWYDDAAGFAELIDVLDLGSVRIHRLSRDNAFTTKRLLEQDDTENSFLVYAPFARPPKEDDWLLDLLLCGEEFTADKASFILNDLGSNDLFLKDLIRKHQTFFDNQERYRKLQAIPHDKWNEESLELGMMAVVCKQKTAAIEGIVKALLVAGLDEAENDLWQQLRKWPGEDRFWHYVKREYGYNSETPSLKKLLLSLMITSLGHNLPRMSLPKDWGAYCLPQKANGVVFIDHWMNDREDSGVYDKLAEGIERELNLRGLIDTWDVERYIECDTFPIFDQAVVLYILNMLENGAEEYDRFLDLIAKRKVSHWYERYKDIYAALTAALELMRFRQTHATFPVKSPYETFTSYAKDYYQADQAYRHFCEAYDNISDNDILKRLQPMVENLYENAFLQPLSSVWTDLAEQEMREHWPMAGIRQQKSFYTELIRPVVKTGKERVFVIISDGLRYEAAAELAIRLNQDAKGSAEIIAMQGVAPSYTKLGMAGLLPGGIIEVGKQGQVFLDGKETENLNQRQKILQDACGEAAAISLQDLTAMSRDAGREFIRPLKLLYIYHNVIDAVGDKAVSEHQVFGALQSALAEIERAIKYIVNQLSGTNIMITADHGFLYQRQPQAECDKVEKGGVKVIDGNRRFYLTSVEEADPSGTISINLDYLLGDGAAIKAVVPRGVQRFKTGGGLSYVHGGIALQEIVLPLVQFRAVRASKGKDTMAQKADIKLINTSRKITNNAFTLDFFQTERISDRITPRRLRLVMIDPDDGDKRISDEKLLIADKSSEKADERIFKLRFILKSGQYDKNKDYYLVLINEETELEYDRIVFTVNIGIGNDFDDF